MTALVIVLAALGGGIGAVARFLVDGAVARRTRTALPWGILVVNTTGSLLLGLLTGLADSSVVSAPLLFVLGAGVLGGYTTFSTAMVDTIRLLERRAYGSALVNAIGMLIVTSLASFAGVLAGRAV